MKMCHHVVCGVSSIPMVLGNFEYTSKLSRMRETDNWHSGRGYFYVVWEKRIRARAWHQQIEGRRYYPGCGPRPDGVDKNDKAAH